MTLDTAVKSNSIAIVGGGASGSAVVIKLAQSLTHRKGHLKSLTIFDPLPIGVGLAFNSSHNFILCNTSIAVNSLYSRDQAHLLRWLQHNPALCDEWSIDLNKIHLSSFIPRGLYQKYLAFYLHDAIALLREEGVTVEFATAEVNSIAKHEKFYTIETTTELFCSFNHVFVCTGLNKKRNLNSTRELDQNQVLQNMYNEEEFNRFIKGKKDFLIIGMKQSAIDAALMLRKNSSTSSIKMVSRTGVFPAVRSRMLNKDGFFAEDLFLDLKNLDTRDSLSLVFEYLKYEKIGISTQDDRKQEPLSKLASELLAANQSCANETTWEDVVCDAITFLNTYWSTLSKRQKRTIKTLLEKVFFRYISAIPTVNARALLEMEQHGILSTHHGLITIKKSDQKILVFVGRESLLVDGIIDATGLYSAPPKISIDNYNLKDQMGIYRIGATGGNGLIITNYMNAAVKQIENIIKQGF